MKKLELIFIPTPGLSHLVSAVEAAKLLLHRDGRLAITVLIMNLPNNAAVDRYTQQTSSNPTTSPRLRLLHLPAVDGDAPPPQTIGIDHDFIDKQTAPIRETITKMIEEAENSELAGLVLDMFCTNFVEIGREFGIPSYVFFTSGSCALGLSQFLVSMKFELDYDLTRYRNSDEQIPVNYFNAPVPAKVLPAALVEGSVAAERFMNCFKRIREAKGVMVNTFHELEPYVIDTLNSDGKTPKVYPVGPILNREFDEEDEDVKKWLDEQDENSVIFLCFGSMGRLHEAQIREISLALENSGCKFLWSMRNLDEVVLPEGFLERTKGVGKVIGWAAQVAVLAHPAVGGFISHCGWNSILESVWFGVPIATFPLYAEQQLNAFYLVREMGVAEMITLGSPEVVGVAEIEAAIQRLMAAEGVRGKVKEMQRKAREALVEGGSSYDNQSVFIEDVIRNMNDL